MRLALFMSIAALAVAAALPAPARAWGGTAHAVIDRAAIEAIPDDGPTFLRRHVDYIAGSASLPDAWRGSSENFAKIAEDPNHGWFREQFTFLRPIPRSRYEFVIALFKRHEAIRRTDPATAARTNVRWTGTLPYAAIEAYDRIVVCMRAVRAAKAEARDSSFAEQHAPSMSSASAITLVMAPSRCTIRSAATAGAAPIRMATPPTVRSTVASRAASSTA